MNLKLSRKECDVVDCLTVRVANWISSVFSRDIKRIDCLLSQVPGVDGRAVLARVLQSNWIISRGMQ